MDKSSSAYKRARAQAEKEYGPGTSAYKSGRIVHLYKQQGGRFRGPKPGVRTGLPRWFKGESWIQVVPYLERGRIVPCGAGSGSKKGTACRPLRRQNKRTPSTIRELVKKHTKAKVLAAARKKVRSPSMRLNWNTLTTTPSK
jgi:hypothetical protein